MERYAAIKHEVFYPAADAVLAGEDKELLAKAQVKHDGIQDLIEKAENTPADDPSFDATVTVLAEHARRLMRQEEEELFPRRAIRTSTSWGPVSGWRRARPSWGPHPSIASGSVRRAK